MYPYIVDTVHPVPILTQAIREVFNSRHSSLPRIERNSLVLPAMDNSTVLAVNVKSCKQKIL